MSATLNALNPGDAYAELAAASNFSFLRGASHPKDLVLTAICAVTPGWGWPTATPWRAWCGPGAR